MDKPKEFRKLIDNYEVGNLTSSELEGMLLEVIFERPMGFTSICGSPEGETKLTNRNEEGLKNLAKIHTFIKETAEQTLEEWVEQEIEEYLSRIPEETVEALGNTGKVTFSPDLFHIRGALEVLVNLTHCRQLKIDEDLLAAAREWRDALT